MINDKILKTQERAVFALRSLYEGFGYSKYKMSKFEEYDLYVRNKDFLISDSIITFTDTNGKLMALKPDVTLSIIKNTKDIKGLVQKLYYNENVYRVSKDSLCFKEINQTGLECIGDVSLYEICEVVYLAAKSLETIDSDYILDISHAGLIDALIKTEDTDAQTREKLLALIQNKNADAIKFMAQLGEISKILEEISLKLIKSYKATDELTAAFQEYTKDEKVKAALDEFVKICQNTVLLCKEEKINIDFSIVNDTSYYSGVVIKGYIKGIPTSVLSGGQYDKLMNKMGKTSGAVGFAVYLDLLEKHGRQGADFSFDYVIVKNENANIADIIKRTSALTEQGFTVCVVNELSSTLKYKNIIDLTVEEGR